MYIPVAGFAFDKCMQIGGIPVQGQVVYVPETKENSVKDDTFNK